jgi:hypothetical protein
MQNVLFATLAASIYSFALLLYLSLSIDTRRTSSSTAPDNEKAVFLVKTAFPFAIGQIALIRLT